jgi:hypothetical protein
MGCQEYGRAARFRPGKKGIFTAQNAEKKMISFFQELKKDFSEPAPDPDPGLFAVSHQTWTGDFHENSMDSQDHKTMAGGGSGFGASTLGSGGTDHV